MKFKYVLLLFLLFRFLDFVIIYLTSFFIPYLGFFPYREIAQQYNLPGLITSLANFDGAHYLIISREGYNTYQQAFFPLYSLLIRGLSPVFINNNLLTAIFISNISFLFGLYIFSKYLRLILNKHQLTVWIIIFLLLFPTSFFFGAVYTEGIFFLFFSGTVYFLKKEKLLISALFAFFAALTKLIGVLLIIFFILKLLNNFKLKIKNYSLLIAASSPILGLLAYSLYLFKTTGDPLFFLSSQWAFGAHRSSDLIFLPQVIYRYLKIFFTAQFNFQYFIALFELLIFGFVLIILILDLIKNLKLKINNYDIIGLNLFSLVNLILPTLTGTFSSIPRYALFSISFFIWLGQIRNKSVKAVLAFIFLILHIVILGFFSQGYFVS